MMRKRITTVILVAMLLQAAVPNAAAITPVDREAQARTAGKSQPEPRPTSTPPPAVKSGPDARSRSTDATVSPTHDDFDSALWVSSLPYYHVANTTQATVATDDPQMGCGAGVNANTVWYRIRLSTAGLVEVNSFGSDYDTVLAVFTGYRGALNLIACNDDAAYTLQSQLVFEAAADTTYYLEVADYGDPGGGLLNLSVWTSQTSVSNSHLQTNLAADGRYVIGTTGGSPDTLADDDKRLLYGYPSTIGTSYSTLRVNAGSGPRDYRLGIDILPTYGPVEEGGGVTTVWEVEGIRVEQHLAFAENPDSGYSDLAVIRYHLRNTSGSQRRAGLRVMLDTMIGDNDGAPLFIVGAGRLTYEQEFYNVPEYWVAWESPTFEYDSLKAKGVLRGLDATRPDRLVVAHWDEDLCPSAGAGLYSAPWDYGVDPSTSITCDSAVALYYDLVTLRPTESRTIQTYYGLAGTGSGLDLTVDVADFVAHSREQIQEAADDARDVSTVGDHFVDKLEADKVERVVNLAFNSFDLFSHGVSWARIGRGLNHISTPGYKAALHASWRGWTDGSAAARHWYKPLYDAIRNNRKLVFNEMVKAGLRYYGKEAGLKTAEEFVTWLGPRLVPGPGTPFRDYIGAPAARLGSSYRSELLREQDDLLAFLALQDLTPAQVEAYREDMIARQQANQQVVDQLGSHRDLLWHSYQKALEDEAKWWKFWGPLLLKYAVVGGATLLWDGPGFYLASVGTAAVATIYDATKDTRAIKHDGKMLDQAWRYLTGRVSLTYMRVTQNAVGALNLIRSGDWPEIPEGSVNVETQSYGHYRLWPKLWWAEESSQLELNISNSSSHYTTYMTSAAYDHSRFWTGTERFLVEGESLDLDGFASDTADVPLKSPEIGMSPDRGSPVAVLVLGGTETGIYPISDLDVDWEPTRIEQGTLHVLAQVPAGYSPQEAAEAPAYPYPLSSMVTALPDSSSYQLTVAVLNPFTMTLSATVTQTLPSVFTILDSGDGQVVGRNVVWNASIEPETGLELRALLSWEAAPGESVTVPAPDLAFRDPSTGQGDTYEGRSESVPAPWPLRVSYDVATTWQIGTMATPAVTLTNTSSTLAALGTFTTTVSTVDGDILWSVEEPISIAAGASEQVPLSLAVPARMGYVVVSGEARVGEIERELFMEAVYIRGIRTYLPILLRE